MNYSSTVKLERRLREADFNVVADSVETEFVRVPLYDAHIPCGTPTEIGYVEDGEYIHLPKSVVKDGRSTISVFARGDSMIDAGIEDGDILTVKLTKDVHDGDAVVVSLDGEVTCKALFRPSTGCTVLLPRNEAYEPIVLEEGKYDRVDIIGVVTCVMRPVAPVPYRVCSAIYDKFKKKRKQLSAVPSEETVRDALRQINPQVDTGRKWFAVMRVLMDCGFYKSGDYRGFVEDLQTWLGTDLKSLPAAPEVSRMCVQSFSKPFSQWDRNDAPVSGKRFDDYYDLAAQFKAMIE